MSPRSSPFPLLHPARLRSLRNRLRLSIRDAGLTDLSIHPEPREAGAFWELEPTPLVVPADEWALLERALHQRARLVNAFLTDLYGGQRVLHERILPPEITLADPYYRRPCLGLTPEGTNCATLLRFDLLKTSQGWVFTDTQTNTPIGLSYAVQNRRFLTQEAGELYRGLPEYHSIINFPLQLLDALRALAPRHDRPPSIIVLSTGPRFPFFSEHSFLARKMGLPLAQGDDLLVLDNCVYFKTVAGLERVDVIYRRLNDAHLDPVVFPTERSTAGVPGLMQCIRAGNVVVANAPGSGVAENRALHAYLPQLMRFYLSEKPVLPSIATYTCGDTDQLDYVLDHADELKLRPVHDPRLGQPATPALALGRRLQLPQLLRENPFGFVAQARVESAASLAGARRRVPFRFSAFVLARGRQLVAFPGGLVTLQERDRPAPRDRVGITADVVVLAGSDGASRDLADLEATVASGAQPTLPGSRAAENLFWLGRYLERSESTARMLSILHDVALEEIPPRDRRHWLPVWRGLLEATGHHHERISARVAPQSALSPELMVRMTLDAGNPSSVLASVRAATDNARQLRDFVSPEAGGILTGLEAVLDQLAAGCRGRRRSRFSPAEAASSAIRAALLQVNACFSTASRTMLHDAGWHFLLLGVLLERAIMTCSVLRHVLGALDASLRQNPAPQAGLLYRDNPELSALLRMLGSQDAYRRLYQTRSQPRFVAELFLQQPAAPRGILPNLLQVQSSLRTIRTSSGQSDEGPVDRAVAEALARLQQLRLDAHFRFVPADPAGPAGLAEKLGELLQQLTDLHPLLSDHYFSHQARLPEPAAQAELGLAARGP